MTDGVSPKQSIADRRAAHGMPVLSGAERKENLSANLEDLAGTREPAKADDRPSIAELQRETPRWPSDWRPALGEEGEWVGFWWCKDANGSEDRVSADTSEDYANDFARVVALTRNAAPVLLEIAAAALEWAEADDALGESTRATRFKLAAKAHQTWRDLRAALVKVRP